MMEKIPYSELRLNRWVARASGVGRRCAEKWIAAGEIFVDGKLVDNPAQRVLTTANVFCQGKQLQLPRNDCYLLFHKPAGTECTFAARDGNDLRYLLDRWPGLRYGGRLDKNSEGLLLLSSDGTWLHRVTHPSAGWVKVYHVTTTPVTLPEQLDWQSTMSVPDLGIVSTGLWIPLPSKKRQDTRWEVRLKEGKKRQIRRLAEAMGGKVLRLLRTEIGPFRLGDIKPGSLREISHKEAFQSFPEGSNSETGSSAKPRLRS